LDAGDADGYRKGSTQCRSGATVTEESPSGCRSTGGGPRTGRGLAFARGLAACGLSGVQHVTSDCHQGLHHAVTSVLPGASCQPCRVHYHRNLLTKVPRSARPWVSTLVRTIFEQPDAASMRAQHGQVVAALEAKFP
jgi:transposase-like protein